MRVWTWNSFDFVIRRLDLQMSKKVHAVAESLLVAEMFMMTFTIVDSLVSNKSELQT